MQRNFFRYIVCWMSPLLFLSCNGQVTQPGTSEINIPGKESSQTIVIGQVRPPSSFRDSVNKVINRFEKAIRKFETEDSLNQPAAGQVLFVGSSSIRGWKTLAADFTPVPVINRGFGGSTLPEVIHYASRIIFPYQPRAVVLYAGENDMTLEYSVAGDVLYSFKEFYQLFRDSLPETDLFFVSIKPCPYSWNYWPKIEQANTEVETFILETQDPRLHFMDIRSTLFLEDGNLDASLFLKDKIHINSEAYKRWTAIMKPVLQEVVQDK